VTLFSYHVREESKRPSVSTDKPRDTKSRFDEEKRLRDDVINKYTDAVKDFNREKKMERKKYDFEQ